MDNATPEGCRRLAGLADYEANRQPAGRLRDVWRAKAVGFRDRANDLEKGKTE